MPNGLTSAQLDWVRTFTGLDPSRAAATNGARYPDQAMLAGAPAGSAGGPRPHPAHGTLLAALPKFDGTGAGSKAPLPDPDEIKRKAYAKINAGGSLEPADYEGLDTDDITELLKAEIAAKNKKAEQLAAELKIRNRFLDLEIRLTTLILDKSAVEEPSIDAASKLADQVSAAFKANKVADGDALLPAFEVQIKQAEALRAERPKYAKQAKETGETIAKMTDAQLDALSPNDTAQLMTGLVAAGKPKGAELAAQMRLYKHTKLDKAFVRADADHEKQVAKALKGDRELEAARKNWGHADPTAKIAALQRIADAQCKVYGIPKIEILRMPADQEAAKNDIVVEGGYLPDGKIHLNFGPDASNRSFKEELTTIFHETAHYYQHELAEKFKNKELKPTDPLYAQAALFAANDLPGAVINDKDIDLDPAHEDEILKSYRGQPNERHSFKTSEAMATETLKTL